MTDRPKESPGVFQAHLREAAAGILERFPEASRREIYALSFNIWRIDYDDRRPYVAIGYNTEGQYERERRPDDPGEARWNYACWLLDGFETLGNVPEDPAGGPLYVEEIKRLGLWYDGDDVEVGADDVIDAQRDLLNLHFADACIDLARHLHDSGRIEQLFGRPLPVVVFDMDCPGWEIEATEAANPPELIEDFLTWQRAAEEA
ncbi:hypothetical protein [Streptomyces sp. NL15-2K]|uniref:hypothetical protein n=1 Tax=Streptomyces sp. NL15-2K TaxID=376149 RepID=UPI000F562354|nr:MULTISPECIES: hypothetical protein [Actinomycetes]WKX11651.1 hypothetical protein Q4V64_30740 [Kutzneria buriramensis]GCB46868.1 hypothetical protein SNL152K_4170 [Streptomyces sp. NL15-2K]